MHTPALNIQTSKSVLQLFLEKCLSSILLTFLLIILATFTKGIGKSLYVLLFSMVHKLRIQLSKPNDEAHDITTEEFFFDEPCIQQDLVQDFVTRAQKVNIEKRKFYKNSAEIKIEHENDMLISKGEIVSKAAKLFKTK
jgi:hypothetical protein